MLNVYITNKNYTGLIQACEDYELQYEFLIEPSISITDIYAAYLGAYIIADDLNSARFLRKRMLINMKKKGWAITEDANRVWEVCKALWNKDYHLVYPLLNNGSGGWSTVELQSMLPDILESIRERVLNNIVAAYTTISLSDTIYYFGLPENDLIQVLTSKGWTYEPTNQVFTVKKPDVNKQKNTSFFQLTNIADTILQLEKF